MSARTRWRALDDLATRLDRAHPLTSRCALRNTITDALAVLGDRDPRRDVAGYAVSHLLFEIGVAVGTNSSQALVDVAITRLEQALQSDDPDVALAAVRIVLDANGLLPPRVTRLRGGLSEAPTGTGETRDG